MKNPTSNASKTTQISQRTKKMRRKEKIGQVKSIKMRFWSEKASQKGTLVRDSQRKDFDQGTSGCTTKYVESQWKITEN